MNLLCIKAFDYDKESWVQSVKSIFTSGNPAHKLASRYCGHETPLEKHPPLDHDIAGIMMTGT